MRKASKMFVGLALAGMLLTGCDFPNNSNANSTAGVYEQQQIYQLYVANGGTKNYEEWLESVRGADGSTFLAGANDPAATDGKNGDIYVNTTTWDFFLKISGAWNKLGNLKGAQGEKGDKGDKGDKGEDGFDGEDGAPGADGKDGKDGENGASVLTGSGKPAADLGKDGDSYIDIATWDFYVKKDGKWKKVANLTHELTWNADVLALMNKYLGFVLPYTEYDEETMYYGYSTRYESSGVGMLYIYDDCEENYISNYGAKLLAAGFEEGGYYTGSEDGYTKYINEVPYEVIPFYDAGNCIHVYMPKYVPPYSAEYFLEQGFKAVEGWPAEHVATTIGADKFAGVALDATWYESFGINDGEYYYDLLASEGSFKDAIYAQAEAAGFAYYEASDLWFNPEDPENPEITDDSAYVKVLEKDGWSLIKFFGETLPLSAEYFTEKGYTAVEGFPQDLVDLAFGAENSIVPVNADADWFTKYTKYDSTYQDYDRYWVSADLATEGNFTADFGAALEAVGFEKTGTTSYSKAFAIDSCSVTVKFERGFTQIHITGAYIFPNGELVPPEPAPKLNVADLDKAIEDFFAEEEIEYDIPEFEAANAEAYFKEEDDGVFKVFGSSYWTSSDENLEEMQAWAAAFDEEEWVLNIDDYGDCHLSDGKGCYINFVANSTYFTVSLVYNPVVMEFPLDEINEWLADQQLGFQLTEALPDPAGEGYTITYGYYYGYYPYVEIDVSGNAVEAMIAVLDPIITAAGYEYDDEYGAYYNDYYDMVSVAYDADEDVTYVIFMY